MEAQTQLAHLDWKLKFISKFRRQTMSQKFLGTCLDMLKSPTYPK